ncbi:hypothetical protein HK102_009268 [Quaeritorhiza haematococci]|nr:hypothetical protein HK102_009268 [Quaeritorhiza haematococci]
MFPPIFQGTPDESSNRPQFQLGQDDPPSSLKLSNVEAQRIMSVLSEAEKKVHIIGLLPDVIDRRAASVFPAETMTIMTEYRQLEQKYKALWEMRENGDKSESPERIAMELKDAGRQLRITTRSLHRHFLNNSNALSKLRYLKSTKSPAISQFETLLHEVKMLIYERLKTTVEEEKMKQDQLSVIISKEQKTSQEVKSLQEELEKATRERISEVSKKNEIIKRLKEELRDIKQQAEETTKRLETRSKQKEDLDLQQFKQKEVALKQEIANLGVQLADITVKHRDEEAQLRKKKFKIESEVENWIHKYDQDMEEKQNEIEDVMAIFTEEKAQLDELQSRYRALQREYEKIMDERRAAEEAKKEQERLIQKMHAAATKIQALYRGHIVRKEMAKKKKDGKGKKEKKAKAKK